MPDTTIVFTTDGAQNAERLRNLAARIHDRSKVAKELAVQLLEDAQRNFESDGELFGNLWPPLAASTEIYKRKRGIYKMLVGAYGKQQYTKTGKLRTRKSKKIVSVATHQAARIIIGARSGGALRNGFYQKSSNTYAAVGNDVPYASFHETGTSRMPRRQILPSGEWAVGRGIVIFEDHLMRAWAQEMEK